MNREQGLLILEQASLVANQELTGGAVGAAEFRSDGSFIASKHLLNGKRQQGLNRYPVKDHAEEQKRELPLSEVADSLNVVAQNIINLINRYNIIQPKKATGFSPRETYVLSQKEVGKLRRFFSIRERLHKPVREAVYMLEHDTEYTHAAHRLHEALKEYDGDPESWMDIVEALSLIPDLSETERRLLILVEGGNNSLLDIGSELGIKSEREVITLLEGAYRKAGRSLFDLYKLATTS